MARNIEDAGNPNRCRVIFPGLTAFHVRTFFREARSGDLSVYLYPPHPSGTRVIFPKNGEITWTFTKEDRWCTFSGWTFDFVHELCIKNRRPLTRSEIENWRQREEGRENANSVARVENGGGGGARGVVEDFFAGDTLDVEVCQDIEAII